MPDPSGLPYILNNNSININILQSEYCENKDLQEL